MTLLLGITTQSVSADPFWGAVDGAIGGAIIGGIIDGEDGAADGAFIGGTIGAVDGAIREQERRNYYRRYYEPRYRRPPPRYYAPPQRRVANVVIDTQRALRRLGYNPGPIDGVAGRGTVWAIREYQADNGLRVDGQVSRRLLNHMRKRGG